MICKILKQKLSTEWFSRFITIKNSRNFSGINFSYTNRLDFLLVITVLVFKTNLIKSKSSKNHGHIESILTSSQFIECVLFQFFFK